MFEKRCNELVVRLKKLESTKSAGLTDLYQLYSTQIRKYTQSASSFVRSWLPTDEDVSMKFLLPRFAVLISSASPLVRNCLSSKSGSLTLMHQTPKVRKLHQTSSTSAEAAAGAMSSKFGIVERGRENTEDYRVFFQDHAGNVVSPFHDIPLR